MKTTREEKTDEVQEYLDNFEWSRLGIDPKEGPDANLVRLASFFYKLSEYSPNEEFLAVAVFKLGYAFHKAEISND